VITPEALHRTPLDLPLFEIRDGRIGGLVDCRSPEGRRVLMLGHNVLYVGATNVFSAPLRNVPLRPVLEGIAKSLDSLLEPTPDDIALAKTVREHLDSLGGPAPVSPGWAA
jgi:hypothetical protein